MYSLNSSHSEVFLSLLSLLHPTVETMAVYRDISHCVCILLYDWWFVSFLPLGDDVSMVGYGAFGQACGPSITSGILSAVITVEEKPVMLQATCAVHGGSSGGALFATHSGKLLGISPLSLLPYLSIQV